MKLNLQQMLVLSTVARLKSRRSSIATEACRIFAGQLFDERVALNTLDGLVELKLALRDNETATVEISPRGITLLSQEAGLLQQISTYVQDGVR